MNDLLNLSEDNTVGVLVNSNGNELKLTVCDFDKSVTVNLTKEQSCELRKLLVKAEVECGNVSC